MSDLSVEETLRRLHAAGLDSLPGGGAEVLVDRVRSAISPHKIPTDTWLDVMRVAHGLGMRTTATMMFGSLDTPAERIEHLRRIRDLQDETGGFTAFIPWTFQAGNTELAAGHTPATGFDYLRLLAVSRIYLDNVPNIQASWVTQGLKMGQVALAFGANDMGSTMIEENVVAAAGVRNQCDVDEMVRLIRAAGRTPVQRDTLYGEVRRYWSVGVAAALHPVRRLTGRRGRDSSPIRSSSACRGIGPPLEALPLAVQDRRGDGQAEQVDAPGERQDVARDPAVQDRRRERAEQARQPASTVTLDARHRADPARGLTWMRKRLLGGVREGDRQALDGVDDEEEASGSW